MAAIVLVSCEKETELKPVLPLVHSGLHISKNDLSAWD